MKSLKIKVKMALLMLIFFITLGILGSFTIFEMKAQEEHTLKTLEQIIRVNYDQNIKEQVQNATSLLEGVYQGYQAGEYSIEEAKKIGADLLREMRYGTDGYFWADNYDGTNVVLLGSDKEGTNRLDVKDSTGFPMIKEVIKVGQQSGGGFVDYLYPKNGESEPSPKRSYSLAFEPFGWVIGTGNYTDYIDNYIDSQRVVIGNQINLSINKLFVVIVSCAVLSSVLCLYIVRGIVKPIKQLNQVTKELASGNLNAEININSKDEVGQLGASMKLLVVRLQTYIDYIQEISSLMNQIGNGDLILTFNQKYDGDFQIIKESIEHAASMLNETLTQINIGADQVASGSEQVSLGAQSLSQGATEQASSIEELSATIDSIAHKINNNCELAMEAMQLSATTTDVTNKGKEQMRQMVAAMNDISKTSNQIGNIIKNIDDIAFQTNILALNAAVEAARAGSAGKGFAVVADEVRNLAGKSAESAKNTAELIETSLAAIERGTKIVHATAKSLEEVASGQEKYSEVIYSIVNSSGEQAESIAEINIGVEQISAVVQTNSATAEESAASSEELSGQAQMLKEQISKFKLKNSTSSIEPTENHDYTEFADELGSKY